MEKIHKSEFDYAKRVVRLVNDQISNFDIMFLVAIPCLGIVVPGCINVTLLNFTLVENLDYSKIRSINEGLVKSA